MNYYIDIYSHILPQIDDGVETFNVSMEMLRIACRDGIKDIILTPHYKPGHHNAGPEKIHGLIRQLRQEIEKEDMDICLHAGNEFYYHDGMFKVLEDL